MLEADTGSFLLDFKYRWIFLKREKEVVLTLNYSYFFLYCPGFESIVFFFFFNQTKLIKEKILFLLSIYTVIY